jgi:hypothetical protein
MINRSTSSEEIQTSVWCFRYAIVLCVFGAFALLGHHGYLPGPCLPRRCVSVQMQYLHILRDPTSTWRLCRELFSSYVLASNFAFVLM